MKLLEKCLTGAVSGLLRVLLGVYFRRIELFHEERVPLVGPVLFASNHPGSVTDAFVIGTSVRRQVHFVATVQLFRIKPLAWLLRQCGIIPVNRLKDDPRAMRTVAETFEACFQVLERGEAVGIFPEGITYDDAQLKTVKTGAARMALELEDRHEGRLGLLIAPVGLTYSAKERYRSEVLIHFGEPVRVADFLPGYREQRKECIGRLNAEIERRLQALIIHLPGLEQARVVEGVKRLYLEKLRLGNLIIKMPVEPQAEELLLTQAIADAVQYVGRRHPERLAGFVRKLDFYDRRLRRLQLSDETVERLGQGRGPSARRLGVAGLALLGSPLALFGWLHRLLPGAVVSWVVNHLTQAETRKAQTAHAAMLAGLISFGFFYALYVLVVHRWFGWPASFWYALSLPVSGLVAHYYLRELSALAETARTTIILWKAPFASRRMARLRSELIAEIETMRRAYRQTLEPARTGSPDVPK